MKVAVLMGSASDQEKMAPAGETLAKFGIEADVRVLSAHRNPAQVVELVSSARENGYVAFICGAGMAAHLAGVVAAHTTKPVIGVPIDSSALKGLDALLSTVQMPPGVPVATVAIGKPGATNAGVLAAQMIALGDASLGEKLVAYKKKLEEKVEASAAKLAGK